MLVTIGKSLRERSPTVEGFVGKPADPKIKRGVEETKKIDVLGEFQLIIGFYLAPSLASQLIKTHKLIDAKAESTVARVQVIEQAMAKAKEIVIVRPPLEHTRLSRRVLQALELRVAIVSPRGVFLFEVVVHGLVVA